jgi:hypothetical protein
MTMDCLSETSMSDRPDLYRGKAMMPPTPPPTLTRRTVKSQLFVSPFARLLRPLTPQTDTFPICRPKYGRSRDDFDLWHTRITAVRNYLLHEFALVARDDAYRMIDNHDSGANRAEQQAGDLVRTVDGQPVGNVDNDRALFLGVAEPAMARVTISREGRNMASRSQQ